MKNLEYITPRVEVVEIEIEDVVLSGSGEYNIEGVTESNNPIDWN